MRILLAIDGSRSSDQARDLVAALPLAEGDRVRVVTVAPTLAELGGSSWPIAVDELDNEVVASHQAALDAAEGELRAASARVAIEPTLLRGRPASLIVEAARTMPADLIVVGHRGHGRWASILLGSVAAEIVDQAPCPVLVARDETLGPIILADDLSLHARAAESAVIDSPIFSGLPITVVTVVEEVYPPATVAALVHTAAIDDYARSMEADRRAATTRSDEAARRLGHAGLEASAEVRHGGAAHEIIAAAREHGAGLVVMGTRGQTGLRRLILGSVARKVMLHAPCSVLVVPGAVPVAPPVPEPVEEHELVSAFG